MSIEKDALKNSFFPGLFQNSLSPSVVISLATEEFRALLIKLKAQPKDFSKIRTPWRKRGTELVDKERKMGKYSRHKWVKTPFINNLYLGMHQCRISAGSTLFVKVKKRYSNKNTFLLEL